jgi:hypothetical protein
MWNEEQLLKMAVIAGAAKALQYKNQESRLTDGEIIQQITKEVKIILKAII